MQHEEYVNMKCIGKVFGKTSTAVGKELTECGYRESGKPTRRAYCEGMALLKRGAEHPEWTSFAWNKAKVCELLEAFGWKRTVEDE